MIGSRKLQQSSSNKELGIPVIARVNYVNKLITRKHKHMLDVVLAYTNKYCIDSEAKCRVVIKELTKIIFTFCFAAWSFLLKGLGGVFEDFSIVIKIRNIL